MLKTPVLSFLLRQSSLQGNLVALWRESKNKKARSCDGKLFFYIKAVVFTFKLTDAGICKWVEIVSPKDTSTQNLRMFLLLF